MKEKKILWLVAAIEDIGGGERLLFEGLKHYKAVNVDVQVVTWRYNEKAFFDGSYRFDNINLLTDNSVISRKEIFKFAWQRAKSIFKLYAFAKKFKPDLILCQSEYDAIFAGLLGKILGIPYRVLVFGQTYQFSWDMMKYSIMFKKHLVEIVESCKGYKDTIPLIPPKMSFLNVCMNNTLSVLRYYFIRNAEKVFPLSKQVAWEVEKIYKIRPIVLRAGFSSTTLKARLEGLIDKPSVEPLRFLMVNRLAKKKRVDITLNAFKLLGDLNVTLDVVGGGEELENLRQMVTDLELNDRIKIHGRLSDDLLTYYLLNSHVFISMDVGDFDITVVEAMSYGLDILVSTDFVIDDTFSSYNLISHVAPTPIDLAIAIREKIIKYGTVKPNYLALDSLTWEHYFDTVLL